MSELFRKKSLERISSPEQLDSYMKVVKPSAWIILIAVFLMLGGTIIWSLTSTVEIKKDCYILVSDKETTVFIPEENFDMVTSGMKVDVAADYSGENSQSIEGSILNLSDKPMTGQEILGEKIYAFGIGSLERKFYKGDIALGDNYLPQGLYLGTIELESSKPISFAE